MSAPVRTLTSVQAAPAAAPQHSLPSQLQAVAGGAAEGRGTDSVQVHMVGDATVVGASRACAR
jgi:hypothetical protein